MKEVCFVCEKEKEIVSHRAFQGEGLKPLCFECDYSYDDLLFEGLQPAEKGGKIK